MGDVIKIAERSLPAPGIIQWAMMFVPALSRLSLPLVGPSWLHLSLYFFVRFSIIRKLLRLPISLPCYFVFLCQYLRLQASVYLPLISHFAQLLLQVLRLRIATMKLSIALIGASVGSALAEVPHIVAKVSEHEDFWPCDIVTYRVFDQGSKFFYSNNGTEL